MHFFILGKAFQDDIFNFAKYFRTAILKNTSGQLLLIGILIYQTEAVARKC